MSATYTYQQIKNALIAQDADLCLEAIGQDPVSFRNMLFTYIIEGSDYVSNPTLQEQLRPFYTTLLQHLAVNLPQGNEMNEAFNLAAQQFTPTAWMIDVMLEAGGQPYTGPYYGNAIGFALRYNSIPALLAYAKHGYGFLHKMEDGLFHDLTRLQDIAKVLGEPSLLESFASLVHYYDTMCQLEAVCNINAQTPSELTCPATKTSAMYGCSPQEHQYILNAIGTVALEQKNIEGAKEAFARTDALYGNRAQSAHLLDGINQLENLNHQEGKQPTLGDVFATLSFYEPSADTVLQEAFAMLDDATQPLYPLHLAAMLHASSTGVSNLMYYFDDTHFVDQGRAGYANQWDKNAPVRIGLKHGEKSERYAHVTSHELMHQMAKIIYGLNAQPYNQLEESSAYEAATRATLENIAAHSPCQPAATLSNWGYGKALTKCSYDAMPTTGLSILQIELFEKMLMVFSGEVFGFQHYNAASLDAEFIAYWAGLQTDCATGAVKQCAQIQEIVAPMTAYYTEHMLPKLHDYIEHHPFCQQFAAVLQDDFAALGIVCQL